MQRAHRKRKRTPAEYVWEGRRVAVYDDARTCLTVIELFRDEGLTPKDKLSVLLRLMFEEGFEPFPGFERFLPELLWEACALDVTGEHADECGGDEAVDWEADEQYIRASVLAAYGKTWDEIAETTTLREALSLVLLCPHETPMGQAVYYRTAKPPRETKYNREEVKAFRERRRFWRVKKRAESADDPMESMSMAAADTFRALERRAKGA